MTDDVVQSTKEKMEKTVASVRRELATVRAGRANPSILDKVTVDYYGMNTPLNQLASITAPEARLLVIQPYDKSSISDIEKGIQKADLGLSPSNDGDKIRISIPQLTEERRQELAKLVKRYAEDGKVAIRNIRRDSNDELKKSEKDSAISEDDYHRYTEEIQKLTDQEIQRIDSVAAEKEKEIMEV